MRRRPSQTLPSVHRSDLEAALADAISGDVSFDSYTRHLYSTDASMYAIEPVGVVFPRDADDVTAVLEVSKRFAVPVLPRGGGTSLAGQTVGRAVVLDFSRHMHGIRHVDPEARVARVQPGVVQDDLNRAVEPHGLLFAPDTSTANRATIGGMIGNNSCGSRSARYGMTIDHVEALDVVLSDGSQARFQPATSEEVALRAREQTLEGRLYREIPPLIQANAQVIRSATPAHWRRSGGYRLERMLPEAGPFSLTNLVVGSEGTLAVTVEATVRLVPRPRAIAAIVGHFESVEAAIDSASAAIACNAAAVELVDRMILDLARSSPLHSRRAALLTGSPGAILWVEFYGDTRAEAVAGMESLHALWKAEGHGYAYVLAPTPEEQKGLRELRKAGLGLLMSGAKGRERSLAFVEDTAVDPARLGEFTRRFTRILDEHGLRAGFYGHASAACLHIRPYMDLVRPGEVAKMRAVAEAVLELVMEFGGMNSSEHGDGLARSEFNRRFFGDAYCSVMRDVKHVFDPAGRMNPGKKVDVPPMTESLREPSLVEAPPLRTHFSFQAEGGFRDAANRCARIGACRKSPDGGGTMCPSYMATRNEEHSTRGRANALVRALSAPDPEAALGDDRLFEILDLCLECKACKTECPLSVDMATMKSEFLAHYYGQRGVPLRARMFGNVRTINRMGSALAPLSNLLGSLPPLRAVMDRVVGIDRRRPLPRFRRDTLVRWFRSRSRNHAGWTGNSSRQTAKPVVVFLADSFTSYTEPEIGQAAIELLEAAGWDVRLAGDVCCGRALISKGLLEEARVAQRDLVNKLAPLALGGAPIVGCEPSCVLTLREELPALVGASRESAAVAARAGLVDDLIARAFDEGTLTPDAESRVAGRSIIFHGHCHQKAGRAMEGSVRMLEGIPGAKVNVLDAGCCGMAGSFGFEREHYDLSMRIGAMRLFPAVSGAPDDALVCATGVSCRQQIAQGTARKAVHPITLVRDAVKLSKR